MSLHRICKVDVVTATPETLVFEVAQEMRTRHVGSVIVVEERQSVHSINTPYVGGGTAFDEQYAVGLVTDRDMVTKVVAAGLNPKSVTVKEIMMTTPSLINIHDDLLKVIEIMRVHGLRRLPVIDDHGRLLGVVTMEDVLGLLGQEITNLAEAVRLEVARDGSRTSSNATDLGCSRYDGGAQPGK